MAGDVDGSTKSLRAVERPLLQPELRTVAERSRVRRLADECDDTRAGRPRDLLEPLGRSFEVGLAQVARASRRPAHRVRQTDTEREKLRVLLRLEEPGREAGRVEQAPEVVARVRERRLRTRAPVAGVDADEDEAQVRPERVGNGVVELHRRMIAVERGLRGVALARVDAQLEHPPKPLSGVRGSSRGSEIVPRLREHPDLGSPACRSTARSTPPR